MDSKIDNMRTTIDGEAVPEKGSVILQNSNSKS